MHVRFRYLKKPHNLKKRITPKRRMEIMLLRYCSLFIASFNCSEALRIGSSFKVSRHSSLSLHPLWSVMHCIPFLDETNQLH